MSDTTCIQCHGPVEPERSKWASPTCRACFAPTDEAKALLVVVATLRAELERKTEALREIAKRLCAWSQSGPDVTCGTPKMIAWLGDDTRCTPCIARRAQAPKEKP